MSVVNKVPSQKVSKATGHPPCCWMMVLSVGWEGLGGCIPADRKSRLMLTLGSDHVAGREPLTPGFCMPICCGIMGPPKLCIGPPNVCAGKRNC